MTKLLKSTVLLVLAGALVASSLRAQAVPEPANLVGVYDSTPIPNGVSQVQIFVFKIPFSDRHIGLVSGDFGDGLVNAPSETMGIDPCEGGGYEWTNRRGNTGKITWDDTEGRWDNTITSGPNTGNVKNWTPQT